jgi:hypothetical protein
MLKSMCITFLSVRPWCSPHLNPPLHCNMYQRKSKMLTLDVCLIEWVENAHSVASLVKVSVLQVFCCPTT